jgi:hypothetical protein
MKSVRLLPSTLTARSINDLCSEVAWKDTWRRRLLTDSFIFSSHDLLRFYTRLDVQVCRSDVRSPLALDTADQFTFQLGNGSRVEERKAAIRSRIMPPAQQVYAYCVCSYANRPKYGVDSLTGMVRGHSASKNIFGICLSTNITF